MAGKINGGGIWARDGEGGKAGRKVGLWVGASARECRAEGPIMLTYKKPHSTFCMATGTQLVRPIPTHFMVVSDCLTCGGRCINLADCGARGK